MSKATPYLKKTKGFFRIDKDGLSPVYINYGHKSRNILIPTNVKVKPEYWQGDPDQPIKRSYKGYTTANQTILNIKAQVNDIVRNLTVNKIDPTIDSVRAKYYNVLNDSSKKNITSKALELFRNFIDNSGNRVTRPTINAYDACYNCLKDFEIDRHRTYQVEELDLSFYDDFVSYLFRTKNLADSTIGKHIKNLKVFLHHLEDRGYSVSKDIRHFKVFRAKKTEIFLTQDELEQLYLHNFSDNLKLERVRDRFYLECSTGLRVSDLKRITKRHIHNDVLYMTALKNINKLLVPLSSRALAILEKYDYKLPNIADSNYNKHIKDACRDAEIKTLVEVINKSGGVKTITQHEKHELITSHAGVKTFITHCAQKGISPKEVSAMTGKSIKVILEYYEGVDEEHLIAKMKANFN